MNLKFKIQYKKKSMSYLRSQNIEIGYKPSLEQQLEGVSITCHTNNVASHVSSTRYRVPQTKVLIHY